MRNKGEVRIDYTNYRGERRWRTIVPVSLQFRKSAWHGNRKQWYLVAIDVSRGVERDFAMQDVHAWVDPR